MRATAAARRPLRLVRRMEAKPEAYAPRAHDFAIAELVISKGGEVVRRLRPVPAGFVEVPNYEN